MPGETSDTEKLYKPVESKELYAEHTTAQHLVLENTPSDIEARMRRVIATARSPGKTNLRMMPTNSPRCWTPASDEDRTVAEHPKIRMTSKEPKHLAWLALRHRLHAGGILHGVLLDYLWDRRSVDIVMAFDDKTPVAVAAYVPWGQLMVFTRRQYRRRGIAARAARLLSRKTGVHVSMMVGGPGRRPLASQRFFEAIGVEFMP